MVLSLQHSAMSVNLILNNLDKNSEFSIKNVNSLSLIDLESSYLVDFYLDIFIID